MPRIAEIILARDGDASDRANLENNTAIGGARPRCNVESDVKVETPFLLARNGVSAWPAPPGG